MNVQRKQQRAKSKEQRVEITSRWSEQDCTTIDRRGCFSRVLSVLVLGTIYRIDYDN